MIRALHGDCRELLPTLGEPFHACVCDPPYELGFMGRAWDRSGVAFRPETWRPVFDALLPGAYLVAFGGTRTEHRTVCAIEDAGFEIRDKYLWLYGQGFPKSANAERSIDVELCTLPGRHFQSSLPKPEKRQPDDHICPSCTTGDPWEGWHSALKPAWEPIVVGRRPLVGNLAENVLAHGTGALHIDACRVAADESTRRASCSQMFSKGGVRDDNGHAAPGRAATGSDEGRWPANVLHSGDEQVEAAFAAFGELRARGNITPTKCRRNSVFGLGDKGAETATNPGDSGTASRYFQRCAFSPDELRFHYSAKADAADRADSRHATVKPVALLRWLVRLVTPPGGRILDPFAGSGTTGEAAMLEGFDCTLIEQDAKHVADIQHRIKRWSGGDTPLFKEAAE